MNSIQSNCTCKLQKIVSNEYQTPPLHLCVQLSFEPIFVAVLEKRLLRFFSMSSVLKPYSLKLFLSNKYTYAQIVRKADGHIVAAASTIEKSLRQDLSSTSDKVASTKYVDDDFLCVLCELLSTMCLYYVESVKF